MRIVTDDGVGLAVEVQGTGPGLVLVHGFGGAKEDFADFTDVFARDHTVVAFDHRGHGESDKPSDLAAYSLARLRADVLNVADGVGLDTFRLLGHSMGGMAVRRIPIDNRERVDALIMMDTTARPIPGFDPDVMEIGAEIALNEGKQRLKEVLDAFPTLDTPAYQRTLFERPGYKAFMDYKWNALSERMWAALNREMARQDDDLEAMRAVSCPTLILVGEQDAPFLISSRAMAETIPGARLVVIPDAGHSPQFENPDAWLAAMEEFLTSLVRVS